MPVARYRFPRARGDVESAARAKTTAWRGIAFAVIVYAGALALTAWHLFRIADQ